MRKFERKSRGDSLGTGHVWIRNNIIGLVALFVALSGTAVAANMAGDSGGAQTAAKKKKAKPGPRGPAGPQGIQGLQGSQGPAGPNTQTAWANVTDADGVGADPVLTASQGVISINDGVAPLDGFVCYNLSSGVVPDLILGTDQMDDGGGTFSAEGPPPLNCAAGFEASSSNTPVAPTGDFFIAFYDLI